ncbi:trypsin-like serine peptidase [Kitasatospora azatica]|uniref:trypsin-like serine peptidase n=1 Tax=Kitasatospora azatica TaxID=58347 RepID=UPI00068F9CA1|nr:serine protease [Kitasatospora azatica]
MSSQRRRHRKQPKFGLRPMLVIATLGAVLAGAIAGVSLLTSRAAASSQRSAAAPSARAVHGKDGKGSKHRSASSYSPAPAAAPAAPQPSTDSPVAQLPPSNAPSPSASPSAAPSTSPSPSPSPSDSSPSASPSDARALPSAFTTTASPGPEADRVGALFTNSVSAGNHFCTASVVHSATRNLLLTAAHCLSSTTGVQFAPGYRNGQSPYGSWQVTQIYTTTGWSQNGDVDQDFAFLEVAPNAKGQQIEDVVGGGTLGTNESFTATVRLYGYPDSGEAPLACSNATTQQSGYQRRIDCPAYSGGTSGGPWISTTTGRVIGVIGGYQQGGDTDDTSYSAYFDATIANLYQTAVASSAS